MNAQEIADAIATLRRRRVPVWGYQKMYWYLALEESERAEVEERIAITIGGTCQGMTDSAYVQAHKLAEELLAARGVKLEELKK